MAQITEDMLKLSQVIRNDLRLETVDLSGMVSEIVKDLSEKEPERKIGFAIESDIFAKGDPSLLHIALYNLIENAWKFSAKLPQAKIEFGITRQENSEVYFVKDNGIGFNMQYNDKLFKPFQRLHANTDFPGHGIGLATVQRVISRHGGKIWADSEQGKGTAIYFTLGNYGMQS
jgi:light-regulated signal transduction histidine kinase (bacteriophytochrome)